MRKFLLSLLLLAGVCGSQPRAHGFSLLGEIPAWFTDQTGLSPGDIYGPVNLGEEYRWVVPEIVYGFDESFLNYFGQRGVEEVEKAIAILAALPSMDSVDLNAYPTLSMRVNYRARDLQLLDLKSQALQSLMEQLGLGTPNRFVFTLRGRDTPNQQTNYLVMMRNFDPDTWEPTPYINGQLWTYLSIFENQDAVIKASTIPEPVDPLILAEPVATFVATFSPTLFGFGSYFTGLTRDDVGGLRYIYRSDNQNAENLPPDATASAGIFISGGDGSGSWTPIPGPSTNAAAGGGVTDPNAGGGVTPTTPFYAQGVRGGVARFRFVRSPNFLQTGGFAFTNRYTDTARVVITNGVERTVSQNVVRALTAPDIIFAAEDLVTPNLGVTILERAEIATSNDAINGNVALDGPGQFDGPGRVSFEKVGPTFFNSQPNFLSQSSFITDFIWGSFDGSTNEPVVYPSGTSIREIEGRIFTGR